MGTNLGPILEQIGTKMEPIKDQFGPLQTSFGPTGPNFGPIVGQFYMLTVSTRNQPTNVNTIFFDWYRRTGPYPFW